MIGVVVYHLKNTWLPGGFAGVDVFFVLSGFFITGLLLREAGTTGTLDLRAFWGRRARRLLPAAGVVLVGTVVAGALFVDAIDARRFAQDGLWTALFGVNWHYAQQGTSYLADTDPSPFTHFWSLGVEEQFYLVWPVLLLGVVFAIGRRRPQWLRGSVGVLAIGLSIASFVIAWQQTTGLQPYAYFATYSRAWQLGLGALLAAFATALGRLPLIVRTLSRWVGVAAIIGFYVQAPLDIVYPGWAALVPTLGAGLIVISGLPRAGDRAVAGTYDPLWMTLRSRVSQAFGRYSYGWYLWHWPPLVLLPLIVRHPLKDYELVVTAVVALVCAIISYHVLEHPVRSSRVLARRHGRLSLALGAAVVIAGVATAEAVTQHATHVVDSVHVTTAKGTTLTPSPAAAEAEVNQASNDGCELSQSSTDRTPPECRYLPDQGKGDVVLIGDSHAGQWMPAVKAASKDKGWGLRVWTRDNCPFADVTKIVNGSPYQVCDEWRDSAVRRIVKDRPSLVVVASYPPPGGPGILDPKTNSTASATRAKQVYLSGMKKELAVLAEADIPTLLIDDQPRYDEDAAKCVLQHENSLSACSAPQVEAQHAPIDAAAAKAVPGISNLDLTNVFCKSGRCYQVVDSMIAYLDNNHLTHEMAKSLTPKIESAMQGAVDGSR